MFQAAITRGLLQKQCYTSNIIQTLRYFSSELDFDKLVKKSKVVVFMKGTPQAPRCGFSHRVVQIFKMYGVEFDAHDVLSDEKMRQGIKDYTSWPTIPQVFINGVFIGGCDILMSMHFSKKLTEELEKAGVKATPPEEAPEESKS